MGGALATGNSAPKDEPQGKSAVHGMRFQVQCRLGVPAARSFCSQRYCCDCSPQGSCDGVQAKWAGQFTGRRTEQGQHEQVAGPPHPPSGSGRLRPIAGRMQLLLPDERLAASTQETLT